MAAQSLTEHPVHLGLGATAIEEPRFTGQMEWYADYIARHATDGHEGRLVSLHSFETCWDSWEMHPHGSEVVLCISGRISLIQEFPDGRIETVSLEPGYYAINPPGVWHTADVTAPASAVFITAGSGTEGRPR
jgi:mannose-6-phosphate isomerase-like protein (cupin superfamily)